MSSANFWYINLNQNMNYIEIMFPDIFNPKFLSRTSFVF